MLSSRSLRILPAFILVYVIAFQCYSQTPRTLSPFVIDMNRQFVYLKFDHMGKGIRRSDDETETRLWLRFVNNCNVPIDLHTFGTPEGSPKGEVGVMNIVVIDPPPRIVITTIESEPPATNSIDLESAVSLAGQQPVVESKVDKQPEKPPSDYWFEVGSAMVVRPGQEVLFSIPVNQLGQEWHVQIPFSFEVPRGKGFRPPEVGGEPEMFLSYHLYDLPEDVEATIKSKKVN